MSIELFAHPFSSYCQKALIAFYENDVPFTWRMLEDAGVGEELASLWPMKRFPILRENGRVVLEASIVIEYLQVHHPGPVKLIPEDPDLALEARMLDHFFDNYVMTPQGKFVFDALRPAENRDPHGVEDARKMLDTSYAWLDQYLQGRTWAVGETFTLADCAAAPSLFYADWTHRIPEQYGNLTAYRTRLLQRPSFARAVDEARRFRHYFPLGAPDRD
ncbi:glutathione S-transferase family protein [Sphingomonas sp. BT-65]|uniref:glutathione S-transferase family protein n=1 Tax=Sphingomonas sp. BT-65 TaxID=2989821 RepID=UPI0022362790|nr:glutathione S-transferase family protein [Sphingomonas sp. BT-65]MCW4462144.1 glutathione S-transferase family protein [Sphingomonas sp. BT-65]